MGCCCNICLKCGHIFCGCIPLRMASFISCFCMFVSSFLETIGEFYIIIPMIQDKLDTPLELFVFVSGQVTQFFEVTVEMFMTFAVWKKIPQMIDLSSVLYVVIKGIKLLNSFIESILYQTTYSFLVSGCASAVLFLVPVIWGYKNRLKTERAQENNETTEDQEENTTQNQVA